MADGIKIWDDNGVLLVDLTTRLSRYVGEVSITAGQAGSVQINETYGRPWYFFGWGRFPVVTVNGGTISWDASARDDLIMIYGIY